MDSPVIIDGWSVGKLRDKVVEVLQGKEFVPGMISIESGSKPDEVIFRTAEGDGIAKVVGTKSFVCLQMPSGELFGIPKQNFLSQ